MKLSDAKIAIRKEWYKLPEEERKTKDQAALFALKMLNERKDLTDFNTTEDRYQIILGWLSVNLAE